MKKVFADTAYWIALLNRRDQLHARAVQCCADLSSELIVTTEMVLIEVLNHFSLGPPEFRQAAVLLVGRLDASPSHDVIPLTSGQFRNALDLYRQRPDKQWSLTDCASILAMEEKGIGEALTYDNHFVQAGFAALLRNDP
jgi:predicted nucleic acid-binding protein